MAWSDSHNTPCSKIEVQWDGTNWTDETSRCTRWSINVSLRDSRTGLPMLGAVHPGTATVVMDNSDNRFSPDNASSPIHSDISDGIYRVPIRISADYGTATTRQFTGQIETPSESETPTGREVSFSCVDDSLDMLEYEYTTALYRDKRVDEFMATLLAEAGVTSTSLDKGFASVPYLWMNTDNIAYELSRLAQSELGMVFFAKDGTYTFWRMTAFLENARSTSSQATLTTGTLFRLSDAIAWRDAYTGVRVTMAPLTLGELVDVYVSNEDILIAPGDTVTQDVQYRWPVRSIVTPEAGVDYEALSSGCRDLSGDLVVDVTSYAQRASVSFTNNASLSMYVTGFKLRGKPLLSEASEERQYDTTLSPAKVPGTKVYDLRGNPYLQTRAQMERAGQFLRDRLERPRRLWQWRGVCNPDLCIGDRVTVQDSDMGINADAYVLGIQQEYRSSAVYTMTLELLPVANLFAEPSYFILGTSSYADSGSDPLFY